MNLVGKILVLVILVMSAVFMAFAVAVYSTHTDCVKAVDLKTKLDAEQVHSQDLQTQRDRLANDLDTLDKQQKEQIAKLETERSNAKQEAAAAKQDLDNLSIDVRNQTALAKTKADELVQKEELIAKQRDEIAQIMSQRDTATREVVGLTDKVNQAQTEYQRLELINTRLAEQNALAKIHLERIGKTVNSPIEDVPPKIDGLVLAVGRDGLIEISIGSDDGLSRGHTLEVYRGKNYLGRAEVISTQPDKSVAKVLPTHQQGKIEKEDRVATRFH